MRDVDGDGVVLPVPHAFSDSHRTFSLEKYKTCNSQKRGNRRAGRRLGQSVFLLQARLMSRW